MDGHPQPPSPLVVSLGGPAPPAGFLFLGDGIAGDVPVSPTSLRSSGTQSLSARAPRPDGDEAYRLT